MKSSLEAIELMEEGLREIPDIEVYPVACVKEDFIFPEEDFKPSHRHHKYWCPYCGGVRRFIEITKGYLNCEVCRISNGDFYIKKINNIDPLDSRNKDRIRQRRQAKVEKKDKMDELKQEK